MSIAADLPLVAPFGRPAGDPAGETIPVLDRFARPLRSLRVSVTDKCNLRCGYCMPEDEYVWLPRREILTYEEVAELVGVFADCGVERVRLTGGEPLLRRDLDVLVEMVARDPRIQDLALTTNGVLLARQAHRLRAAGLHRVTVSLDTLRAERFRALTRRDEHAEVLDGIAAARAAGFPLKLNTVVIRGFNEDELADLVAFARDHDAEVRFIEYMDVGGATRWSEDQVVSRREMLAVLGERFGAVRALGVNGDDASPAAADRGAAPAERFSLGDGTTFGIIASTTEPFCRTCDRARLTPDGLWLLCLYAMGGVDLKALLRAGAGHGEIADTIARTWRARSDRGAEERRALGTGARGVLFRVDDLRKDPRREMHTRGG